MSDKRISQLVERTAIENNDVLPIVALGASTTNKVTITTIEDYMQANLDMGVTSVGLTKTGDALAITGSPITSAGNINIAFAGTSGQYVNGAGNLVTFPTLTGYVPYTGAATNVNLGEFGLTAGYYGFDLTPTGTPTAQGTMYWNADKESLDVIMNGVTGSVMQDTFFNVKNQTGASIPKGTVVRANGTLGASGRILIAPFLADGTYDSKFCLGVTAETIADGEDGKVTAFGTIRQIDTSAYPNGTILYASPSVAGGFTSTEPTNPNNIVTVAIVIYSDTNNGEVFVRPTFVDNATDIASALGYTPLSGTGTTNYILKFTGTTSIGNSSIQELASGLVSISGTTLGELDLIGTSQATLFLGHNSTIDNVIQSSLSSSFNILNTIGASQTYLMYYDYTSKALSFQTNGFNTRLLIDSSGNIGINTASPSYKLDINGTARVSGQLTLGSTITNGTYTYTLPSATGTLALTSDLSGYLPLSGGTLSGALTIGVAAGTGLDVASDLVIFRASTGFGSPRQITLAAGNGPTTYLEAKGYGGNYITDFGIRTYNSSGTAFEVFFATSAGNVGIGTTGPLSKLQVVGTGTVMRLGEASGTTGKQLLFGVDGANGRSEIQSVWQGTSNTPLALNPAGGNVLIGTTTDNGSKLNVNGAATFSSSVNLGSIANSGDISLLNIKQSSTAYNNGIYIERGGERNGYFMYIGGGLDALTFRRNYFGTQSDVMSLTRDGNVGIGTTAPSSTLCVQAPASANPNTGGLSFKLSNGTTYFTLGVNAASGDGAILAGSGGAIRFYTDSDMATTNERMMITSDGRFLVGATATDSGCKFRFVFDAVSQNGMQVFDSSSNTSTGIFHLFGINNGGPINIGSITRNGLSNAVNFNTTSDYRLKEDYKEIKGLAKVLAIKVYDFKWKGIESRMDGVIAHELAEVLPYAVTGQKDDKEMQSVDYSKIVPILVKAIQELTQKVNELESKIK